MSFIGVEAARVYYVPDLHEHGYFFSMFGDAQRAAKRQIEDLSLYLEWRYNSQPRFLRAVRASACACVSHHGICSRNRLTTRRMLKTDASAWTAIPDQRRDGC